MRSVIDTVFVGAARLRDDWEADVEPELSPFQPAEQYPFGVYERAFAYHGNGVLGVDSPRAMFEMTEALDAAGMRTIMTDYFGERPAFSVKKTTLRRTEPGSLAGWHQDGAFLGVDTRALNIWTALSPCGIDAPSLDIFAEGSTISCPWVVRKSSTGRSTTTLPPPTALRSWSGGSSTPAMRCCSTT